MGEIKIVSPGKTRGYPYPVRGKKFASIESYTLLTSAMET